MVSYKIASVVFLVVILLFSGGCSTGTEYTYVTDGNKVYLTDGTDYYDFITDSHWEYEKTSICVGKVRDGNKVYAIANDPERFFLIEKKPFFSDVDIRLRVRTDFAIPQIEIGAIEQMVFIGDDSKIAVADEKAIAYILKKYLSESMDEGLYPMKNVYVLKIYFKGVPQISYEIYIACPVNDHERLFLETRQSRWVEVELENIV